MFNMSTPTPSTTLPPGIGFVDNMPISPASCLLLDKLNPNPITFTDFNTMAIFAIATFMEQGASEASIKSLIEGLESPQVQDAYQVRGLDAAIATFKEQNPFPDYVDDILTAARAQEIAKNDAEREVFGVQGGMN